MRNSKLNEWSSPQNPLQKMLGFRDLIGVCLVVNEMSHTSFNPTKITPLLCITYEFSSVYPGKLHITVLYYILIILVGLWGMDASLYSCVTKNRISSVNNSTTISLLRMSLSDFQNIEGTYYIGDSKKTCLIPKKVTKHC